MTTQEPTRAWMRSGTDGTGARVCTPIHKAVVEAKIKKNSTGKERKVYILCLGVKAEKIAFLSYLLNKLKRFYFRATMSLISGGILQKALQKNEK